VGDVVFFANKDWTYIIPGSGTVVAVLSDQYQVNWSDIGIRYYDFPADQLMPAEVALVRQLCA
jgi:hypothetical protein